MKLQRGKHFNSSSRHSFRLEIRYGSSSLEKVGHSMPVSQAKQLIFINLVAVNGKTSPVSCVARKT